MRIRTLFFLFALAVNGAGQAEIYTWKDGSGRTHFGDRPPPDSTPEALHLKINTIHRPEIQKLESGLASERHVVIYTTDWCGVCRQAKDYFNHHRIPYEEYDVEKSARGKREFKRLSGSGVPIILVGDHRMNGFSPERFEQLYNRP